MPAKLQISHSRIASANQMPALLDWTREYETEIFRGNWIRITSISTFQKRQELPLKFVDMSLITKAPWKNQSSLLMCSFYRKRLAKRNPLRYIFCERKTPQPEYSFASRYIWHTSRLAVGNPWEHLISNSLHEECTEAWTELNFPH